MSNTSLAYYKVKSPASILNSGALWRDDNRRPIGPATRPPSGLTLPSIALRLLASALIILLAGVAQAQRPAAATHIVRPGETLGLIAQSYGIDLSALASANGISNAHIIHSWQELTIPADAARQSPSTRAIHIVAPGESLGGIAEAYGLTLNELQVANNIWSWFIYAGQELTIPGNGSRLVAPAESTDSTESAAPVETSPPVEFSGITHKVQFGETLGTIARDYGVSLAELQSLNDIWTWLIYVGQELEIPGSANRLVARAESTDPAENPAQTDTSPPVKSSGITHKVQFGETLGAIARDYGVSLAELQSLNDIWTWLIYVGQELEIPGSANRLVARAESTDPAKNPAQTETSPPVESSGITHKVQFGETLGTIARDYGVSLADLQSLNDISTWLIYVEQDLDIPAGGAPPEVPSPPSEPASPVETAKTSASGPNPAPAPNAKTHTVQPGETLFRIAKQYGLSLDALIRANGIADVTRVHSGLVLRISNLEIAAPPATTDRNPPQATNAESPAPVSQPIPAGNRAQYTVQPGDFLSQIGAKFGMNWLAIVDFNGIANPDNLHVGTVLTIPTAAEAAKYGPIVTTNFSRFHSSNDHPGPRIGRGKEIVVLLSTQTAYAYENGQLMRRALISSGLADTPTVKGDFKVRTKVRSQRMRGEDYDLDNVEWVMYFYSGYALHGTWWHHNFGTPMSRGCVNMTNADAKWFYEWASVGTPVHVRD